MKNTALLYFVLLCSSICYGNDDDLQYSRSKLSIKAGYYGEFILHPGFYAGVDYNVIDRTWFDLHWDTEIGGYLHKWNNNSFFSQSSIGARFTTKFSVFTDLNVGLGYMLSTPNGQVYQVDELGNLAEGKKPVSSHFKPVVSMLFGWDGMKKKDIPLTISIGLEGYWQTGFNHIALPHAAGRIGITYQLKTRM